MLTVTILLWSREVIEFVTKGPLQRLIHLLVIVMKVVIHLTTLIIQYCIYIS